MAHDPQDLVRLEERRAAAIESSDLAALADTLGDDYFHVLAPGKVVTKADYVEMIRRSPRSPHRGELRVRLYGDTAIIEGDLENHIGAPGDVSRVIPAYCTQVAVHRDGRWQFVSYILTQKRALRT